VLTQNLLVLEGDGVRETAARRGGEELDIDDLGNLPSWKTIATVNHTISPLWAINAPSIKRPMPWEKRIIQLVSVLLSMR
jgi:hypothetical protein